MRTKTTTNFLDTSHNVLFSLEVDEAFNTVLSAEGLLVGSSIDSNHTQAKGLSVLDCEMS